MILNFILALLPILWLIVALTALKMPSHAACLISLGVAVCLATAWWQLPAVCVATAALEGVLNALWPICLVVVAALFTYNLTVRTGAMEDIKRMLAGVSTDMRVLALLIGWGFGNFMEGMAGFGTAVAIPASMLVGLGMNPLAAVVGCLVVNSTPTAFGSVGVPTATLATVTGLDAVPLSGSIALVQCVLTFLSPFFLVCICGGGAKALRGMVPFTLAASLSFVVPWFATAQLLGPELPDIIGAVCSMACIIMMARMRHEQGTEARSRSLDVKSREEKAFGLGLGDGFDAVACTTSNPACGNALNPLSPTYEQEAEESSSASAHALTLSAALKAWSPFILILVLLLGTSSLCPPVHDAIAPLKSAVVVYAGENPSTLTFSWVNTPGVMIFLAAIGGGLIQGASPRVMTEVLADTLRKYWRTVLTICCVLAVAKVMGSSGMIADIAAVLVVATGPFYPLVSPLIGALGAFVTGSGTSTNVLFGALQAQTATALGLNLSWMAAANVMGAGIGKMICPQSIAIGAGAAGLIGQERAIMGAVFKYFVLYVLLAGVICMAGSLLGF